MHVLPNLLSKFSLVSTDMNYFLDLQLLKGYSQCIKNQLTEQEKGSLSH